MITRSKSKQIQEQPIFKTCRLDRKHHSTILDSGGHQIDKFQPYPYDGPFTDGYKIYNEKVVNMDIVGGNEWVLDLPLIDYPITDWKNTICPNCKSVLDLQVLGKSVPRYGQR